MKNVIVKPSIEIIGIECRTSNSPEAAPYDIPKHWEKFYKNETINKIPNKISNEIIALYCDYEGDHTKPYSLVIGCQVNSSENLPEGMVTKTIPGGSFAVFQAVGEHPSALLETWKTIWQDHGLCRSYSGDYEVYGDKFMSSPQKVDVYIALSSEGTNISHSKENTLAETINNITKKIINRGDLPYISTKRQLELLQTLVQFDLGRFLLQRGGLNGYWTDYIVKHPQQGRVTGLNSENKPFTQLESFFLNQAPSSLATQQRFEIFKKETQKRLQNGISLASIPCGLTADLLDLDFSQLSDFSIFGIDIDTESIHQSQQIAEKLKIANHCQFLQKDAWNLGYDKKFDIISSNGLSIYEPDNKKVIDLYKNFFLALKPNGSLITSFLTPPPIPGTKTEWDLTAINPEHALLQKIIFSDIIEAKWQLFRPEELVKSQLLEAGFTEIQIFYDKAHVFPTVVAKKTLC